MYSGRWKTDLSYYNVRDTYSLPKLLRNARENFDLHGGMNNSLENEADEDEAFYSTTASCSGILHLALRRLFSPFKLFLGTNQRSSVPHDIESSVELSQYDDDDRCVDCPLTACRFKSFEIEPESGKRLEVFEIPLEHKKNVFETFLEDRGDLTALILNECCATLIWLWSEETRFVLIAESGKCGIRSLKDWYRKILSDIALTDSIIIGHPYYWHPVVRRRLSRAMKHFKKLYDTLEKRDSAEKEIEEEPWLFGSEPLLLSSSSSDNEIEYTYPKGKVKVVLSNEKEEKHAIMSNSCLKWSEYCQSLRKDKINSKGDHETEDSSGREKLEEFLASISRTIGAPPEDSISLSLGPSFRMQTIGKSISTVSASHVSEVPVHGRAVCRTQGQNTGRPLRPRNTSHRT